MHEVVKALRIAGSEAEVFVQIERSGFRKIEARVLVKRDEFFVHAEGGASGGEAEDDGRVCSDSACDDASGFLPHLFSVLFENYEHFCESPLDFAKRINGSAG